MLCVKDVRRACCASSGTGLQLRWADSCPLCQRAHRGKTDVIIIVIMISFVMRLWPKTSIHRHQTPPGHARNWSPSLTATSTFRHRAHYGHTWCDPNNWKSHPTCGDCLEVKREYYQNSSVLDCVTQCSQSTAHLCEQFLQVKHIGFVTLGPLRCA